MTSTTSPRAGRPRSPEVRDRVLRATVDLLGRSGYAGLRMDDVAARSGVAKTTVYRRWPSKRDLVLDAVAALLGPLAPLDAPSLEDDVAAVTRWYAARLGHPGLRAGLLGLYAESSADPGVAALLRQRLHEPYLPPVRARLGDRADEAEDLLHLVVGGVLHATVTRGQALDEAAVRRLAAAAARLVTD